MDQRLFKAARLGDVAALNILLEEDPLILEKLSLSPTAETPLHIAALAGETQFAKEIIRVMPSFAWELNQDGYSPMHMASAGGNVEIVRELLTLEPNLCLVKDKGGRNPLHYAVIKGRVHVIEEFLFHCPKAIEEVTAQGETSLHLAVKNNQFEALKVLLQRLEKMDNQYRELINAKDKEEKTILELAKSTKQHQVDTTMTEASGTDIGIPNNNDKMPLKLKQDESAQNAILVAASLIATDLELLRALKIVPYCFLKRMDQRLFKAARSGDVAALNILLEEDPPILEKLSLSPTAENPLHIAALAGQTDFNLRRT
ncbi:hypothetical protein L1049_015184 [Liquidambar formosana]|uniref:Ankyrin repeat-containing protein BDA1-like n=1 Tax=Liquidambar formosana TaxID=63359 RepID=A0AAP0WZJ8_LIQFO